jgi:hypothetical protein
MDLRDRGRLHDVDLAYRTRLHDVNFPHRPVLDHMNVFRGAVLDDRDVRARFLLVVIERNPLAPNKDHPNDQGGSTQHHSIRHKSTSLRPKHPLIIAARILR